MRPVPYPKGTLMSKFADKLVKDAAKAVALSVVVTTVTTAGDVILKKFRPEIEETLDEETTPEEEN